MSRSKSQHRQPAAKPPRRVRPAHLAIVIVAIAGLSFLAWLRLGSKQPASGEAQLIAQGRPALSGVKTFRSEGRDHVPQGSLVVYGNDAPTSGNHYPTPSAPGFYDTPQPPGNLVHALEHGNIVIYYDRPSPEALQSLKDLAQRFRDPWAGVVVAPMPGIGQRIVLTAWTKALRLGAYDAASVAAFADRFRGRGPENAVR